MRRVFITLCFIACFGQALAAPNIVIIMTDDQEDTGSMAYMPKTLSLIAGHGVTFKNSFVNLSLCAPNRILVPNRTGRAQSRHQGE